MGKVNEDKKKSKKSIVHNMLVLAASETLATALLLLMGCMGGLPNLPGGPPPPLQSALVFGIIVATIVQIFGHVSGAHLNPVVSIAAWIWGTINMKTVILYSVAQMIGATLGYATLVVITPLEAFYKNGNVTNESHGICVTQPGENITIMQALIGEFIATSVLILMCCGIWDNRNRIKQDGVPIKFGLAIAALALSEGPYSGCSMNPARSFGPSLITGIWRSHWIYWVSPTLAAVTMPYLYKYVFDEKIATTEEEDIALNQQEHVNSHNKAVESTEGTV